MSEVNLDPNAMVEALRKTTELQPAPPAPDDEAEVDYDRQFNVEVLVTPWKGSWVAAPEDAAILLTRNIKVNGHLMQFESDPSPKDPVEGETYTVDQGEATLEMGVFAMLYLRRLTPESLAALEVSPDYWMEGSFEKDQPNTLILPISSLTVRVTEPDEHDTEPSSY